MSVNKRAASIFLPDWRDIYRRAWSVRMIALAFVLSAAEVAVPLFLPGLVPPLTFALLSAAASVGALIARGLVQKGLSDAND